MPGFKVDMSNSAALKQVQDAAAAVDRPTLLPVGPNGRGLYLATLTEVLDPNDKGGTTLTFTVDEPERVDQNAEATTDSDGTYVKGAKVNVLITPNMGWKNAPMIAGFIPHLATLNLKEAGFAEAKGQQVVIEVDHNTYYKDEPDLDASAAQGKQVTKAVKKGPFLNVRRTLPKDSWRPVGSAPIQAGPLDEVPFDELLDDNTPRKNGKGK